MIIATFAADTPPWDVEAVIALGLSMLCVLPIRSLCGNCLITHINGFSLAT
jgi:hypothetical protein